MLCFNTRFDFTLDGEVDVRERVGSAHPVKGYYDEPIKLVEHNDINNLALILEFGDESELENSDEVVRIRMSAYNVENNDSSRAFHVNLDGKLGKRELKQLHDYIGFLLTRLADPPVEAEPVNLHQIVSSAIGGVNPFVVAELRQSAGYTTADDGTQVPSYAAPVRAMVQVQALSSDELKLVEGLNVQGNKQGIYLNGNWAGLVRPDRRGGDLVKLGSDTFLVLTVLENWPDWTKLAVVLQNGG